MQMQSLLQKLGLTKKEADTYIACLEHGPELIAVISKCSGQKRSTLYYVIEGLIQKGFVHVVKRHRRTYYDAVQPRVLLETLHVRENELADALPELEAIRNTSQTGLCVELREGEDAVKKVYDEIYCHLNNAGKACFVTSIADLETHAPYALDTYFVLSRENMALLRELVRDDEAGRKYVKESREYRLQNPIRMLPPGFPIHNDMALYGEKVALFSFHKRSSVVVIENEMIVQTLQSLFECAWVRAEAR